MKKTKRSASNSQKVGMCLGGLKKRAPERVATFELAYAEASKSKASNGIPDAELRKVVKAWYDKNRDELGEFAGSETVQASSNASDITLTDLQDVQALQKLLPDGMTFASFQRLFDGINEAGGILRVIEVQSALDALMNPSASDDESQLSAPRSSSSFDDESENDDDIGSEANAEQEMAGAGA